MKNQRDKIALGVLAYNEEAHIEKVLKGLEKFDIDIYVINDFSSDSTNKILENFESKDRFFIFSNKKNLGAGQSTKILIKEARNNSKEFLIKIDGDGQFSNSDIEKIIDSYINYDYKFIKSNRFWSHGIVGNIPKIRFFGNILATLLLQISSGTNKLYDPLNGLFGISTDIADYLTKHYPKRYGYPFYITVVAILNNFKTKQINNVVSYGNEKSNLNSFKVFYTLLKLSIIFYTKKYKLKKIEAELQKSAFFDVLFVIFLTITLSSTVYFYMTTFLIEKSFINSSNLLILIIFNLVSSIYFFVKAFNEESSFRNKEINIEKTN